MAKKPQTEEKAKGLIGLKGGKKVAGAAYSVGNYKGKTLNLTKKQLGKSGSAAAAKRTVSISDTKYEGKKVLGPGGKPLTGSVDLGGGNMAVYKGGVRVRAAAPKPKPAAPSRGGSSGGSAGGTTTKPKGGDKTKGKKAPGPTMTNFSVPARNTGGAGRPAANRRNSWASGVIAATGMAPSVPNKRPPAAAPKPRPSVSATPKPREGQRQTVMVGNRKVVQVYRSGRWVPLTGSRGGY